MLGIIPAPNFCERRKGFLPLDGKRFSDFVVRSRSQMLGKEEYILEITPKEILITSGSDAGEFYAEKSLEQYAFSCGPNALGCLYIKDSPRYEYRGFMIDCARHFFCIEDIKRMIEASSMFKLNVFHWHLTDDQGFRLVVPDYPLLAEIGSVRKSSDFGKKHVNEPYSGTYSESELREIVSFCAERYITVIPEFDVPGHTSSVVAAYPETACGGVGTQVKTSAGIFKDVLCPGRDEALKLVFSVLDTLMDIFPSEYIHIGGDEVPKVRWEECPDCTKRMLDEGLKNADELQGWFTNRVIDYLEEHSRKAIVWNESLNGDNLREGATVQFWMDRKKKTVPFANAGGRTIISDFYNYYLDYPYGMTPLRKTYNFNPELKGFNIQAKQNISGVEAPIWTEYVEDAGRMAYMFFPRACAVAETAWTFDINKDEKDFIGRLRVLLPMLSSAGVGPAPESVWNPAALSRASQVLKFFSNTLTPELLKGAFPE
ncbi:MAG: beta-N-acetylhexosaminidase [Clostridiales bacterium]|nr:beta-N-acetylhexosaminidase [Clostridiales bacterium]